MKRVAGLLAALLCSCSTEGTIAPGELAFAEDPYQVTQGSALKVTLRTFPQPPTRGQVSLEYTLQSFSGAPVDGVQLQVVPFMPEMGHGAAENLVITPQGEGRYVVTNVYLPMPGRWELRSHFTGPGPADDSAILSLQIP